MEDALGRGLRIISYGLPGYGASTRQSGRYIASAAQDTADLANALGIERFATWGISSCGSHALACAALLGDRVVAAASLAGVAPYEAEGLDFKAGMGEGNVEEFSAALKGDAALSAYLEPQVPVICGADPTEIAQQMTTLLSPQNQAAFTGELARNLRG